MVQRFTTLGGRLGIPQSTQNVPIALMAHTVTGDTTLRDLENSSFRGIGDGSISCTVRKYDATKGREFWGIVEYDDGIFYISNDPNDIDLQAPDLVLKAENDVPDVDASGKFYRYYTLPEAEPSAVYITLLNDKWERTSFVTDIVLVSENNLVLVSLWGLRPDKSTESFQREVDLLSYFSETLAAGANYASLSEDIILGLLAAQNPSSTNEFITKTELDKATNVVTSVNFPLSAFFVEITSTLAEYTGPNIYFVINNKDPNGGFIALDAALVAAGAVYGSLIRKNSDGTLSRSAPTIGRKIDMIKVDSADNAATGTLTYDYRWDGTDWVDSSHNLGNILSIVKGNGRFTINLRNGDTRSVDTETYEPTGTYTGRTEDIAGNTGSVGPAGALFGKDVEYKDNRHGDGTETPLNEFVTSGINPFDGSVDKRRYKFVRTAVGELYLAQPGIVTRYDSSVGDPVPVTHTSTEILGFVKTPLPVGAPFVGTQIIVVDYGDIPAQYITIPTIAVYSNGGAFLQRSEVNSFSGQSTTITFTVLPWAGTPTMPDIRSFIEDGNVNTVLTNIVTSKEYDFVSLQSGTTSLPGEFFTYDYYSSYTLSTKDGTSYSYSDWLTVLFGNEEAISFESPPLVNFYGYNLVGSGLLDVPINGNDIPYRVRGVWTSYAEEQYPNGFEGRPVTYGSVNNLFDTPYAADYGLYDGEVTEEEYNNLSFMYDTVLGKLSSYVSPDKLFSPPVFVPDTTQTPGDVTNIPAGIRTYSPSVVPVVTKVSSVSVVTSYTEIANENAFSFSVLRAAFNGESYILISPIGSTSARAEVFTIERIEEESLTYVKVVCQGDISLFASASPSGNFNVYFVEVRMPISSVPDENRETVYISGNNFTDVGSEVPVEHATRILYNPNTDRTIFSLLHIPEHANATWCRVDGEQYVSKIAEYKYGGAVIQGAISINSYIGLDVDKYGYYTNPDGTKSGTLVSDNFSTTVEQCYYAGNGLVFEGRTYAPCVIIDFSGIPIEDASGLGTVVDGDFLTISGTVTDVEDPIILFAGIYGASGQFRVIVEANVNPFVPDAAYVVGQPLPDINVVSFVRPTTAILEVSGRLSRNASKIQLGNLVSDTPISVDALGESVYGDTPSVIGIVVTPIYEFRSNVQFQSISGGEVTLNVSLPSFYRYYVVLDDIYYSFSAVQGAVGTISNTVFIVYGTDQSVLEGKTLDKITPLTDAQLAALGFVINVTYQLYDGNGAHREAKNVPLAALVTGSVAGLEAEIRAVRGGDVGVTNQSLVSLAASIVSFNVKDTQQDIDIAANTASIRNLVAISTFDLIEEIVQEQPSSPGTNTSYIVGTPAPSGWTGAIADYIATWDGTAWSFKAPTQKEIVYVLITLDGTGEFFAYDGTNVAGSRWFSLDAIREVLDKIKVLQNARMYYADGFYDSANPPSYVPGRTYVDRTGVNIYLDNGTAYITTTLPDRSSVVIYDTVTDAGVWYKDGTDFTRYIANTKLYQAFKDISTLQTNLATNTGDIAGLNTRVGTNEAGIRIITTKEADNAKDIGILQSAQTIIIFVRGIAPAVLDSSVVDGYYYSTSGVHTVKSSIVHIVSGGLDGFYELQNEDIFLRGDVKKFFVYDEATDSISEIVLSIATTSPFTEDEDSAIRGANSPSAANVFSTILDVTQSANLLRGGEATQTTKTIIANEQDIAAANTKIGTNEVDIATNLTSIGTLFGKRFIMVSVIDVVTIPTYNTYTSPGVWNPLLNRIYVRADSTYEIRDLVRGDFFWLEQNIAASAQSGNLAYKAGFYFVEVVSGVLTTTLKQNIAFTASGGIDEIIAELRLLIKANEDEIAKDKLAISDNLDQIDKNKIAIGVNADNIVLDVANIARLVSNELSIVTSINVVTAPTFSSSSENGVWDPSIGVIYRKRASAYDTRTLVEGDIFWLFSDVPASTNTANVAYQAGLYKLYLVSGSLEVRYTQEVELATGFSSDQVAAIEGSTNPSSSNVFVTKSVLDGAVSGSGWSPLLRLIAHGNNTKAALQVHDWIGGSGTKPATGYIGATGFVTNIEDSVNVRGAVGATGLTGPTGPKGEKGDPGSGTGSGEIPQPSLSRGKLVLTRDSDSKEYETAEGLVNTQFQVGNLREVQQDYAVIYQVSSLLDDSDFVYNVTDNTTTITFGAVPSGTVLSYATHVTLGLSDTIVGVDHFEITGSVDLAAGKVVVIGIVPAYVSASVTTVRFTKVWTKTPARLEDNLNVYPVRPNLDYIKEESKTYTITSYSIEDGLPNFATSTAHTKGTNLLPYAYANNDKSIVYKSVYSGKQENLIVALIGRFAILDDYEYGFGSLIQSPEENGKNIKFAGIILYSTGARFQLESGGITLEIGDTVQVSTTTHHLFTLTINELSIIEDGIIRHWANVTAQQVSSFTSLTKGTQITMRLTSIVEPRISFPIIPSFDLSVIKTLTFCLVESYDIFTLDKEIAKDLSTRSGDANRVGDVVVRNITQLASFTSMTITDTRDTAPYDWATALPISTQSKWVLRDPATGEYMFDLKLTNVGVDSQTGKFRVYFNEIAEELGIGDVGVETDLSRFPSGFLVVVSVARDSGYVHRLKLAEPFAERFEREISSPRGEEVIKNAVAQPFNSLFLENADTLFPYKMVTTIGETKVNRIAYNVSGQSNLQNPLEVSGGNNASIRIYPGTSESLKHGYYYSFPFLIGPLNNSIRYVQIMSQVIRNGYSFDVYNVMTPSEYIFDRTLPDPSIPIPPHMISERTTQTTPVFGNLTGSYTFDFAIKLPSAALGSQAARDGVTWIWFRSRATTTYALNYNIILWHNDHTFKGSSNIDL